MAWAKWNTTSYTEPASGDEYDDVLTDLVNGVKTALACYAGDSDPTSGGTWTSDQNGTLILNTTNEIGHTGDDLGGALERFERNGAGAGSYAKRDLKIRGFHSVSPITAVLSLSGTSAGWTDLAFGAGVAVGTYAVAVHLHVEASESAPGAGVFAEFRKKGVTTDAVALKVYPQVSGVTVASQLKVECDSSYTIQYRLIASGDTSANLLVGLTGYERRV